MTKPFNLNEPMIPVMTGRQFVEAVLKDDWNARKQIVHGSPGDILYCRLTFAVDVPIEQAKEALAEVLKKEASGL